MDIQDKLVADRVIPEVIKERTGSVPNVKLGAVQHENGVQGLSIALHVKGDPLSDAFD